jgi:hypothetical protein
VVTSAARQCAANTSLAHISRVVPAWHSFRASTKLPSCAYITAAISCTCGLLLHEASDSHSCSVARTVSCRVPRVTCCNLNVAC